MQLRLPRARDGAVKVRERMLVWRARVKAIDGGPKGLHGTYTRKSQQHLWHLLRNRVHV